MNYKRTKHVGLDVLIGKILITVQQNCDDEIIFVTTEGVSYRLYHMQDCCENVVIESVTGDLYDLVGEPILMAEEVTSNENPEGTKPDLQDASFTWTFYKFATRKGYVDIRWYGESNGYYSESVDFGEALS